MVFDPEEPDEPDELDPDEDESGFFAAGSLLVDEPSSLPASLVDDPASDFPASPGFSPAPERLSVR